MKTLIPYLTPGLLGGFLTMLIIYFRQKSLFSSSRPRTNFDFAVSKNVWRDVEIWAKEEKYKLKAQSEKERLYQRNSGCLLIRQDVDRVHIEAWLSFGIFSTGGDVAIDETVLLMSRRYRNVVVRRFNSLLTKLESSLRMKDDYKTRTCLKDFTTDKDIWDGVEHWAKTEKFKLKKRSENERIYKKNSKFWTDLIDPCIPTGLSAGLVFCLLIHQNDDKVHVEAWVESGAFTIAADEADMLRKKRWKDNAEQINRLLISLGSLETISSV